MVVGFFSGSNSCQSLQIKIFLCLHSIVRSGRKKLDSSLLLGDFDLLMKTLDKQRKATLTQSESFLIKYIKIYPPLQDIPSLELGFKETPAWHECIIDFFVRVFGFSGLHVATQTGLVNKSHSSFLIVQSRPAEVEPDSFSLERGFGFQTSRCRYQVPAAFKCH